MARQMRDQAGPDCLISGGEPVVRLVEASRRGQGGRNQQLALAALETFWEDGAGDVAFLSGGTDGEDGPTDAAGAFFDAGILQAAREHGLSPQEFLARNDAYRFFAPLDALVENGADAYECLRSPRGVYATQKLNCLGHGWNYGSKENLGHGWNTDETRILDRNRDSWYPCLHPCFIRGLYP